MFVNRNERVFTKTIMKAAIINLGIFVALGLSRMIINKKVSSAPDMLNPYYFAVTIGFNVLQLILTSIIFYRAFKRLNHIRGLVSQDDYGEMAKLQEEVMPGDISSLSTYSIHQLLEVWAVILIGVKIVYDIFSIAYRFFIARLYVQVDLNNPNSIQEFIDLYNSTHGFKYMGMLVAIILGIFITSVFLNDRGMKISAGILAFLFVLTATAAEIITIKLAGRSVNIVGSSAFFQLLQTVGLLGFAYYIRRQYKGV